MSPAVFKTDTTTAQVVGWVRFPDAPANAYPTQAGRVPGLLAALAILFATTAASGQEPEPAPARPDTVPAQGEAPAGPTVDGERNAQAGQRERPVNPTGALLRSIIVPGWGQVAARQPARGAVYFTVWTGGVFMIVKNNAAVNAAKRGEDEELIDSRKQAREDWILFTGLWALLSGVDAWVSAQFAGFEGEVRPPQDGSPGVEFAYPVKIF